MCDCLFNVGCIALNINSTYLHTIDMDIGIELLQNLVFGYTLTITLYSGRLDIQIVS